MANYFPRWTNFLPLKIAICIGSVAVGVALAVSYYATPKAQRVGYQPSQPIPYDHELHVKQLGMDCRHCHSFVEESGHANVPTANTCWNCHQHIKTDSEKLKPLVKAIETGEPIKWVRVHKSPDYVYFNHSAHLSRGISCVSCHGQVNEMPVVYHDKSLSMGFCLDCHRSPEEHIRPIEEVTNLEFVAKDYISARPELATEIEDFAEHHGFNLNPHGSPEEAQLALGTLLKHKWSVQPRESCFTCHR